MAVRRPANRRGGASNASKPHQLLDTLRKGPLRAAQGRGGPGGRVDEEGDINMDDRRL